MGVNLQMTQMNWQIGTKMTDFCPQITVNCEICLFCLIETPCKSLKFNKMTLNSKKVVNWGLQNYLSRYHDPIGNKN